ncbi:Cyanogenic beta-glucosidase [Glycine soja]
MSGKREEKKNVTLLCPFKGSNNRIHRVVLKNKGIYEALELRDGAVSCHSRRFMTFLISTGAVSARLYFWVLQGQVEKDQVYGILSLINTQEDIGIMKYMNLDAYRFSISWSRVLPKGKLSAGVNHEGVNYYNNLINELMANGLQPYVSLFHWDVPQALEDEYGDHFRDYVELCFKEFGNRVKHWITLNEPRSVSKNGYANGRFAPGRCSDWLKLNCTGGDSGIEPYLTLHYQLLAHAATAKLYKTKYQPSQKGLIGITLNSGWYVLVSKEKSDRDAARRGLDFMYMDPLTKDEYPKTMRSMLGNRLPEFSKEEARQLKGSFDFLGLNYYSSFYVAYAPHQPYMKTYCNACDREVTPWFADFHSQNEQSRCQIEDQIQVHLIVEIISCLLILADEEDLQSKHPLRELKVPKSLLIETSTTEFGDQTTTTQYKQQEDKALGQLARLLWVAESTGKFQSILCVRGDHSTPVEYRDHSFEMVPFAICWLKDFVGAIGESTISKSSIDPFPIASVKSGEDLLDDLETEDRRDKCCEAYSGDSVYELNEVAAAKGCPGHFPGGEMMGIIKKFIKLDVGTD